MSLKTTTPSASQLDVPNDERAAFTARVKATGIRTESLEVGEAEVRRLRGIKVGRQSVELGTVKEAVVHHWEVCGYSEDQRAKFQEFKKVRLSAKPGGVVCLACFINTSAAADTTQT